MKVRRMRTRNFTIFLFSLVAAPVFAQSPVRVHIVARSGADGFVDSSRMTDTVKDLSDIVSKRKGLVLVNTPQDSDIVLEVISSGNVAAGTTTDTTVRKGTFGGINSSTNTTVKALPNITAVLKVRGSDYEKEISITRQMFWKDLAKNIIDQAENWINTNRTKLNEIRSGK